MRRSLLALSLALAIGSVVASAPGQPSLTFEDRVKAQEAIERVYYSHQIGATKPFEEAVPRAVIEKKVRKYLDESATLASPVTDALLQHELERMTKATKMPERLAELQAALGNNPLVIRECLARPVLIDRLANRALDAPIVEPALPCGFEGTWQGTDAVVAPNARSSHTAVWTGSLMVIWGGYSDGQPHLVGTGGRYDPATDHWTPTSLAGAPSGREYHTAVWTGNRMIVWGGYSAPDSLAVNTGGVYDPVGDTWSTTSTVGAPAGRTAHTVVWTGSRMVVWGGEINGGGINTGGRYDPVTNSWAPTSMTGAPDPRHYHTAVWTGTHMLIFGGSVAAAGFRYDPQADVWTPMSTVNAPETRYYHTAVWTGSQMLIWGGLFSYNRDTGGRYNPASDTWLPMTLTGAPSARSFHSAVWTGSLMIVWGGGPYPNGAPVNTGGRYDPVLDSWGDTSTLGAPNPRTNHTAIWTGTRMLVWGGNSTGSPTQAGSLETGGAYAFGPSPHIDDDGDGFSVCEGDCNDTDPSMYPGAPQLCDGINTDCSDPDWPYAPVNERDLDGDGFSACQGDCDEIDPAYHPGATDVCNWRDDDCDGYIDGPNCDITCDLDAKLGEGVLVTGFPPWTRGSAKNPSAAWGGSRFAVAFQVGVDGDTGLEYVQLLDKFGHRTVGSMELGGTATNSSKLTSVVWNGTQFAVAWMRDWTTVALSRIRPDGTAAAAMTTAYSQSEPKVTYPTLVWTGTSYGLALGTEWPSRTVFARIDADGHPSGTPTTVSVNSQGAASLAWSGSNFAIAWSDRRDGNGEVYFALIDAAGNRLGGDVRITNDAGDSRLPRLVWNGTGYGIIWTDADGAYFTHLDPTGTVLGPAKRIGSGWYLASDLVWTGTEYRVTGLTAVRLDPAGDPKGPTTAVYSSAAAWTGDVSGLFSGGVNNIYFTRWGSTCRDGDGDGAVSSEDCDDTNGSVYPGATEVCDGHANDCRVPAWPTPPDGDEDSDGDGFPACAGDCADGNPAVHPGASELCNGQDDNCNGQVDEGGNDLCDDHDACTQTTCQGIDGCMSQLIDGDSDGVCDFDDHCPSTLPTSTVVIGRCDSGVPNQLLLDGCNYGDRIGVCRSDAPNHGEFVRCVADLVAGWKRSDLISRSAGGQILRCAAQGF